MAQDAVDNAPEEAKPRARKPRMDVWTRTEHKYRVRAVILLAVNYGLYCGLCVFTHWLHSAELLSFSLESYLRPLRLGVDQTMNLRDFLIYPVSVADVPFHSVVLGLLMATIVAVPIAVSILYRFKTSLAFIAAVIVLAHLPWMGFTLIASCVLASVRPFRLRFRYGAALVGLIPILVYLILATQPRPDQLDIVASPEHRPLLVLPWVLALLAASVMLGMILLIASVVNYRPGAVAPVLAVMLVPPTVLFQSKVGVDEIDYGVLATDFGPRSTLFAPVSDVQPAIQHMLQSYEATRAEWERTWKSADIGLQKQRSLRRFQLDLLRDRTAAVSACDRFIANHPRSRYVPNVLYLKARALDTRLYEEGLRASMSRELYWDFPNAHSEEPWRVLWTEYDESPLSIAAAVRLAQLYVRSGKVDEAVTCLQQALERGASVSQQPAEPRGLWEKAPAEAGLSFQPGPYLERAQELLEFIVDNRDDPLYANAPLQAWAALDSRRVGGYKRELLVLLDRYPDSKLHDNLAVAWANAFTKAEDRAEMLTRCMAAFPDGDALPHALYLLANIEMQALRDAAGDTKTFRESGLQRLRELAQRFPDTVWGRRAAEKLRLEEPRTPSGTMETP